MPATSVPSASSARPRCPTLDRRITVGTWTRAWPLEPYPVQVARVLCSRGLPFLNPNFAAPHAYPVRMPIQSLSLKVAASTDREPERCREDIGDGAVGHA